jgi:glycosyltransferase involved in cell wall biosynthesis
VPLLPSDSDQGITTCLEAMAMAKAVICTQTAGQIGVLEHEVNALLVPPRDPRALRLAIERLWADPELCVRLGIAGRRRVEQHHALDVVDARIAALAGEAVAARHRRRASSAS